MRTTLIITQLALTFALALLGLFSQKSAIHPNTILVGGEYTVRADENRFGDMLLLFTRVNVAKGGQVVGNIQVLGSKLEVAGHVRGDINAYGSDVYVDGSSARVDGAINTVYSLHGLPQIPSILMVIS
jgi:hypothetical protein